MTLILESPHFIEALTFAQLVGLCLGFGGAMFADMLGLRLLFSSRELQLDSVINLIPKFVGLGLALLWASVLTMVYLRFAPDNVPNEIKAILVLMGFLSLNMFLIRHRLMRLTRLWGSPRVFNMSFVRLAVTVALGCMPFAAWCFMLLIVNFTELQKIPLQELLTYAAGFWLACAVVFVTLVAMTRAMIAARAALNGRTLVQPVGRPNTNAGQRKPGSKGRSRRKSKIAPVRITANDHGSLNQDWHESPGGHMEDEQRRAEQNYAREVPQDRPTRSQQQDVAQTRPRPRQESRPHNNGPRLNEATQRANANTRGAAIDYMEDYRDGRRANSSRNGALLSAITQVPASQERPVEQRQGGQRWWEGA